MVRQGVGAKLRLNRPTERILETRLDEERLEVVAGRQHDHFNRPSVESAAKRCADRRYVSFALLISVREEEPRDPQILKGGDNRLGVAHPAHPDEANAYSFEFSSRPLGLQEDGKSSLLARTIREHHYAGEE